MSFARLSPELLTEILFQVVLVNSADRPLEQVIKFDIAPFVVTDRAVLQCWIANGHIILHRVAARNLAPTAAYRKMLRRTWVLCRLKEAVWTAVYLAAVGDRVVSRKANMIAAIDATWEVWTELQYETERAEDWSRVLLL
jgi:hypothetical protein